MLRLYCFLKKQIQKQFYLGSSRITFENKSNEVIMRFVFLFYSQCWASAQGQRLPDHHNWTAS